ncbi:glyoxalase [Bradyrhizobium sp. SK17]|jgi:predicted enzyme related to lactoylglutathione lyase|uniref:VOC family protein n=1 Tax=Bradyrhizobium sp. SK17 TaxID=2057741 RepID=UPI000C314843|nr:VOC family protein [Bradyrhizobium sp. SK17]AUC98056.1 glyoxalase [Bradyrhizobium sp. SK17]
MLGDCSLIALLATTDGARTRAFYENVLGLRFVSEDDFAIVYDVQRTELRVQKVHELTPQPHTALGWSVPDIEAAVRGITNRGGTFERYPQLAQDSDGIWQSPSGARIAWLRDPDGNVLSLTERPRAAR